MNPYRLKALEGLLDYLSGMQGSDLKSMLDQPEQSETPEMEASESPEMEAIEKEGPMDGMFDKGKGISVEKVSVMGKPEGDQAMAEQDAPEMDVAKGSDASDDELEELYNKFKR